MALVLAGCSDDIGTELPPGGTCESPDRLVADGRCVAPGVQDNGCAAGELAVAGGCQPAGLTQELCVEGFVFDAARKSCEPILPPSPCARGWMAIPGDSVCRPVAPCPAARWGGIAVEATTEHVDAAYTGGMSDGSAARPWTTIAGAIAAAAPHAVIAIEAGSYAEDLALMKPLRLWGVCPERVQITGIGSQPMTVLIFPEAGASEVRNVAVGGPGAGIMASASDVLIERVWVHQTGERGVGIEDTLGPASATVTDSLVEAVTRVAVIAAGAELHVERSAVRDTQPFTDLSGGRGVEVTRSAQTGAPGHATIRNSLIEHSRDAGVLVLGSEATTEGVVVRDTLSALEEPLWGAGIRASMGETGERALLTLRSSLVDENQTVGVHVQGSDAVIEGIVARANQPSSLGPLGRGIVIIDDVAPGTRANATVRSSLLELNHEAAVFIGGSDALLEGVLARDTLARPTDGRAGAGIYVVHDADTAERGSIVMRGTVIENSREIGIVVFGSDALLEGVVARATLPSPDDLFGDGFIVAPDKASAPASATIVGAVLEHHARGGLAVFGATTSVGGTRIGCNMIDLAAEVYAGVAPTLVDAGGNSCGCAEPTTCKAISAALVPPPPVD